MLQRVPSRTRPIGLPRLIHAGLCRSGTARGLLALALLSLAIPLPTAWAALPLDIAITLTPSVPSGAAVGSPITWTVTDTDAMPQVYQFSIAPAGSSTYRVVRDFSPHNTFVWAPLQEGAYSVQVVVKEGQSASTTASAAAAYTVSSRVSGTMPVVSATANPLVALFSAPPCRAGTMVVEFRPLGQSPWHYTNTQACGGGLSQNFYVAGLLANTLYVMRDVVVNGAAVVASPIVDFVTGKPTSTLTFPTYTVRAGLTLRSDLRDNVIFHALVSTAPTIPSPEATDFLGRVVWYYDPIQAGLASILTTSMVPGSTMAGPTVLVLGNDGTGQINNYPAPRGNVGNNVLREIDLAGNPVSETNIDRINAELAARGMEPIYSFHHDAERLPNGDTAVLGMTMQTLDIDNTPTDIMGDTLLVLDPNFQLVWAWDAFDHLPYQPPVLGETCAIGDPGPICAVPDVNAVDWLHTNAISWSPADANLTLSERHQDMVIKINYNNGFGDGSVLWRLGKGGDFTLNSRIIRTDPYPWFSHQHDAHYINATTLVLFDNGNTRCNNGATLGCNSRGQVLTLNENSKVATLTLSADLGVFSFALGAAEPLTKRNYSFTAGFLTGSTGLSAQSIEVLPNGFTNYTLGVQSPEYRSYRLPDLYHPPAQR